MWVAKGRRHATGCPRPGVGVAICLGGALLASAQSPSPVVLVSPYSVESLTRREIRELECGLYGLSSYFSVAFAGVADTETLCGRCIRISCVDEETCREGTGSLVAAVVDGAGAEEVAVNSYLARSLVGRGLGPAEELRVEYEVVDCAPYGTILETQEAFQAFQQQLLEGEEGGVPSLEPVGTEAAPVPKAEPVGEPSAFAPVEEQPAQDRPQEPAPEPVSEPVRILELVSEPAPEAGAADAAPPAPAPLPVPEPAPEPAQSLQKAPQPIAEARASDVPPAPPAPPTPLDTANPTPPAPSPAPAPAPDQSSSSNRWWFWALVGKHLASIDAAADPLPVTAVQGELDNRMQMMACGLSEAMYLERTAFAAMNSFAFESIHGYNPCGTCATVTTADGNAIEVMFVDDCGTCGESEMLISKEGLSALSVLDTSVEGATYRVHACSVESVRGQGVYLSVVDSGSYYARFALGNLPGPIDVVRINGVEAERNHLGQFEVHTDLTRTQAGGYAVELTTDGGEVSTATVPFMGNQWLKFE